MAQLAPGSSTKPSGARSSEWFESRRVSVAPAMVAAGSMRAGPETLSVKPDTGSLPSLVSLIS